MTGDQDVWELKRDHRIRLPLSEIVWFRDQVPYLRPGVQLLLKGSGRRPKDQRDFEAVLPTLDQVWRTWLREALGLAHPGHRWLATL